MVFSVNTLLLFLGLVSGFLIPRFLAISEYAFLKTFSLYLSYAGAFSFGFVDSIYLKYGGYQYEIVDKKIFGKETFFFLYFVSIIALLILLVGVSLNSLMIILLGLCIVPVNMIGFFKLFYQSVGEFGVFVAASSLQGIMHIISVLVILIPKSQIPSAFLSRNLPQLPVQLTLSHIGSSFCVNKKLLFIKRINKIMNKGFIFII